MNTMSYKGYIGSVAFSEEDDTFFGKIEGIGSVVTYEGESVSELKAAFHEAVDDYLTFCEERKIEPQKSHNVSLCISLTPSIHNQVALLAKKAGISINAFIREAVESKVAAMS